MGVNFMHFPVINHFWGLDYSKSKKIDEKQSDFTDYYMNSSDVLIAVIGNLEHLDNCELNNENRVRNERINKNMEELMR
jgi:hypothetical protein